MTSAVRRFSSRRQQLDHAFLSQKLAGAKSYQRIAGYFRSCIFELIGFDDTDLRDCRAREVSRRPPRARAMRVASRVAGSVMRAKLPRTLLMFNRFPSMPPQYDIVLM